MDMEYEKTKCHLCKKELDGGGYSSNNKLYCLSCDPYSHCPQWDAHLGRYVECACGEPDCDSRTRMFLEEDKEDKKLAEKNGWCSVFDQYCVSTERVRSRCKLCEKRVCKCCSIRTSRLKSFGFPRSRICHKCLKEVGLENVVDDHFDDMSEIFGFDFRDPIEPIKQLLLSKEEIV